MHKKWIAAGVVAVMLCVGTAHGQLAVIDVAAIAKLVDQINRLKEQYALMQQQYKTMTNTYDQIVWNAKFVTSKWRWKAAINSWRYPAYGNASGTTAPWYAASKNGAEAVGAWVTLATKLPNIIDLNGRFDSEDIEEAKRAQYGMIEIMKGAQENALGLVGDVRQVQEQRSRAIADLEAVALSDDPDDNTAAALANKQLAANLIALRQQQDQMKLQAAATEMKIQEELQRRNLIADEVRRDSAFRRTHKRLYELTMANSGQALRQYKGY